MRRRTAIAALTALTTFTAPPAFATAAAGTAAPRELTGRHADGTAYTITVPPRWDGTLLLVANRQRLDDAFQEHVLRQGRAVAGTASRPGWRLGDDLRNIAATRAVFAGEVGAPARTIVMGDSQGGLLARGFVQYYGHLVDGALPACGGGAGTVAMWNAKLDAAWALKTLIDPDSPMSLVGITDADAEQAALTELVDRAKATPQGRARLALAAAFAQVPAWNDPAVPRPGPGDTRALVDGWIAGLPFGVGAPIRAVYEQYLGGNPSWNTGVDYRRQLRLSGRQRTITGIYRKAGADLRADLGRLAHAPRIAADPSALARAERFITYDGELRDPVLTLHTVGDPAGPVSDERAYRDTVTRAGSGSMLRQAFVDRAGHCTFSVAERVTTLSVLLERIDTGRWPAVTPSALRRRSGTDVLFTRAEPTAPARTWDAADTHRGERTQGKIR
ncbi:hypothetical protein [Actinomadura bangladeshensis]|uniref:Alpha/beta hydrolase n=1 Tax=Actinomadura bangladeshensis TaxID=453573 RepID=A0A4R4PAT9_9ACTN|nr:hypothetical protein [Actinomadura bangladeshensis]TDC18190.1 hypothetical protein E1284_06910 [Actinomadura bangladeshensis]